MPLLGAHMSIAGGLHRAFERLEKVKGEALQIFLFNQRRWLLPPLTQEAVAGFRAAWAISGQIPVAAHDSYLFNLASPDPALWRRSIEGLAEELRRAEILGIPVLVAHPGSHVGAGSMAGLERFVQGLDRAIEEAGCTGVRVLIETTAGQGSSLGGSFEEIRFVLERSRHSAGLGVCFDTCHVFAAGYDLRDEETYMATMELFHRTVGLERIAWFHLNDSQGGLGSRLDRHAHIGKGAIGKEGFRALLNDSRFLNHPMVLETPKGYDLREDRRNLRVLRSLLNA